MVDRTAPGHRLLHLRLTLLGLAGLLLAACGGGALAPPPVEDLTEGPRTVPDAHLVRPSDTLYSIAFEYGLDYHRIAAVNRIEPPYLIRVGQTIRLPGDAEAPVAKPSTTASRVQSRPLQTAKVEERRQPAAAPAAPAPSKSPAKTPAKAAPKPVSKPASKPAATAKSAQAATAASDKLSWRWPVRGKLLRRYDPAKGAKGVDIGGNTGDPVLAAEGGEVVYSGSGLVRYGKLVIVKHNEQYLSAYAHNRTLLVKEGDRIKPGQRIAELGSTGTDRPMLHFEIRRDGKPVDPLRYLPR